MKASPFFCIASAAVLASCASNYPVTYNSLPQGAIVVCGNQTIGVAPVTQYFDPSFPAKQSALYNSLTPQQREAEHQNVRPDCAAHWASGSTAPYYMMVFDALDHPKGVSLMAVYPGDANARAIDEARAMQIQQMQLQQPQMQMQQPTQQPFPAYQPQPLPSMPSVPPPSAPGRTTVICRTLSNGTVVCD